ncbi:MAG: sulfite exporter TauE/SafE family protein, partial [Candidatus Dadabacteria bacterium]
MVDMTAYGLAFITGVLGSFHCIGMCGGFPILISGASGHKRNISGQLLYNFGRVFTYFFLGVLVGALGFMIKEMEPMLGFQVG